MGLLDAKLTGDYATGSREPISGQIHNLAVRQTGYDTVDLSFDYSAANPESHELGVYVDGELVARVPPTTPVASAANLSAGTHTLNVHVLNPGEASADRHGDPNGRRAYLAWDQEADPSIVGYRVYWDEGLGGAVSTLVGMVDRVLVAPREFARCDYGTGAGRISVSGNYIDPEPVNLVLELGITGEGEYRFSNTEDDSVLASGNFGVGDTLSLIHGIRITFHDDAVDYEAGDKWTVRIGPRTSWLSEPLAPGRHRFAVRAFDQAGNLSDPIVSRAVTIQEVLPPLQDVALSWDAEDETLVVSWTPEEGDDFQVDVYSNLDQLTGTFSDHVLMDRPWLSVPVQDGGFTFAPGVQGTLKFYLWPRETDLKRRSDLTLYEFSFPPEPRHVGLILSPPTNVRAIPIAAGGIRLEWDYLFRDTDDQDDSLALFQISIQETAGAPVFDRQVLQGNASASDSGYPLRHFSVEYAGPFAGTQYIQIRAADQTETYFAPADEVSVIPDAEPPSLTGELHAVPQ